MRIKSDFKDYYDGIAALDGEPEPLFLRKTEKLDLPRYAWSWTPALDPRVKGLAMQSSNGRLYQFEFGYVGFCGSVYTCARKRSSAKPADWSFSVEKFKAQVDKCYHQEIEGMWKSPIGPVFRALMQTYPILFWSDTLVINPILKVIGFPQIKLAYAAYAELNTWLSNQAVPMKEIPAVSDKDMIVAKGFDLKSSFRREKREKKRKP